MGVAGMPKYQVLFARETVATMGVEVEAENRRAAFEAALLKIASGAWTITAHDDDPIRGHVWGGTDDEKSTATVDVFDV
jgi:hypothetical protein